jgi:hypothetical protein
VPKGQCTNIALVVDAFFGQFVNGRVSDVRIDIELLEKWLKIGMISAAEKFAVAGASHLNTSHSQETRKHTQQNRFAFTGSYLNHVSLGH